MKYLNKSLQEAYSKLWSSFGVNDFGFAGAEFVLKRKKSAVLNIMSNLKRRQWLAIIGRRNMNRVYKLISPDDAIFALTSLKSLNEIKASRYLPLIIKACRLLVTQLGDKLHSIALYGSVARNATSNFSDVDILIVADVSGKSYSNRLDFLYKLISESEEEVNFLARHKIFTKISILALTKKEAANFMPIYLDISKDGIILFDKNNFFTRLIAGVLRMMDDIGIKKGHAGMLHYWQTDPKK